MGKSNVMVPRHKKGILEFLANNTRCPLWIPYTIGIFCQKVYEPLKCGWGRYYRFNRFLDESQWWSREQLDSYQMNRLKMLLEHVHKNVPYYRNIFRERKLTPEDFHTIRDLEKLPILTKEDVMHNYEALFNENISTRERKRRTELHYTSGSTGTSMVIYQDKKYTFRHRVFGKRCASLANRNVGDKFIQIWSRPFIGSNVKATRIYDPYWRRLSLSSVPRTHDQLDEHLTYIKEFRPLSIIGPASFMYIIACHAHNKKCTDVHFPLFFNCYENLYSFQRDYIKKQFQCDIFNLYSTEEHLIFGSECSKHEGMHIESRKGIMEIVDETDKQLPSGERGRIICTGFDNDLMPLIRYDSGDIGIISDEPCSCGRGMPLLKSLDGRSSEILSFKSKSIYPSMLSVVLEQCRNIEECQFVQEKEDVIKVNVVRRETYSATDTEKLVQSLKHIIDDDIAPEINFVDTIPRTEMGKFQFVVKQ